MSVATPFPLPRGEYHCNPLDRLAAAIDAVMDENPDLSASGWRTLPVGFNSGNMFTRKRQEMRSANFREMVFDALLVLANRRHPSGSTSYASGRGSFHVGRYIGNGAYIVAAILVGYQPVRRAGLGPNCRLRKPQDMRLHSALCGGDYDRGRDACGVPDPFF